MKLDREQSYFLLHGLLSSLVSVRVEGILNMPRTGGALLVCNHGDSFDALIQGLYSGRRLTFMAKAELFEGGWMEKLSEAREKLREQGLPDEWAELAETLLELFSQTILDTTVVSVIRNYRTGSAGESVAYYDELLERVLGHLKEDRVVAVYPEGERSGDGKMKPFKGFAARVALAAQVPIIPAAIVGAHGLSDLGRWAQGRNRGRSVIYRIGKPIPPVHFPNGRDKRAIKTLTREMEGKVSELLYRTNGRVPVHA